jgi:hypothetical protein
MVFPSSFSLTLYVTASPSPTMKGLCSMCGPSNRTLWIKHPMDWSNATTSFLDGIEFIAIIVGSVVVPRRVLAYNPWKKEIDRWMSDLGPKCLILSGFMPPRERVLALSSFQGDFLLMTAIALNND